MNNKLTNELQKISHDLLQKGEVSFIIGYGEGTLPGRTTPVFIKNPGQTEKLIFSPFCINNLAVYLLDYRESELKAGIFAKGCDARGIVRIIQDGQVPRNNVHIIGVPCHGILDRNKVLEKTGFKTFQNIVENDNSFTITTEDGDFEFSKKEYLLPKCLECSTPNPTMYDSLVDELRSEKEPYRERYHQVKELESLSKEDKATYWDRHFQNCLRCYACRNICPACNCRDCIFAETNTDWISGRNNTSENTAFHVIRALHVAGRCVDCGECERVCPVGLPLRLLNQKILKDIQEIYDAPLPGLDPEQPPALGYYSENDPEVR